MVGHNNRAGSQEAGTMFVRAGSQEAGTMFVRAGSQEAGTMFDKVLVGASAEPDG
jgi:hypothetical protein